jgi:hypothetical protein
MLALAVHAELIPRAWRCLPTPWTFIAHVTPEARSLRLAFGLHLDGRVIHCPAVHVYMHERGRTGLAPPEPACRYGRPEVPAALLIAPPNRSAWSDADRPCPGHRFPTGDKAAGGRNTCRPVDRQAMLCIAERGHMGQQTRLRTPPRDRAPLSADLPCKSAERARPHDPLHDEVAVQQENSPPDCFRVCFTIFQLFARPLSSDQWRTRPRHLRRVA